jgi:hypothetical protein
VRRVKGLLPKPAGSSGLAAGFGRFDAAKESVEIRIARRDHVASRYDPRDHNGLESVSHLRIRS